MSLRASSALQDGSVTDPSPDGSHCRCCHQAYAHACYAHRHTLVLPQPSACAADYPFSLFSLHPPPLFFLFFSHLFALSTNLFKVACAALERAAACRWPRNGSSRLTRRHRRRRWSRRCPRVCATSAGSPCGSCLGYSSSPSSPPLRLARFPTACTGCIGALHSRQHTHSPFLGLDHGFSLCAA